MLIAEELKSGRDKRLIKEHKERMFNMRVMGLDWQETHQKRWDDDTLCFEDKCDSEEILKNERMKNEVDKNLNKIYFTSDKHNPYFTKDDKTLPENHPKRIFAVRQSGYLNSNDLETESDLNKFYDLEEMLKFTSDSLEVFPLHKWADPLGKNPYSVMHTDHYFPWHFDGNEFTLSILVQKAEKEDFLSMLQI